MDELLCGTTGALNGCGAGAGTDAGAGWEDKLKGELNADWLLTGEIT
jgi:hypothetical protein